MTTKSLTAGHPDGVVSTTRTDAWWLAPAITFVVFSGFIVYVTWAAFQGRHYFFEPYLSPLYSPVLFTDPTAIGSHPAGHAWMFLWPSWWPGALPKSPALLILPLPGLFRFTCYYYRKAYYRSFGGSPVGCAVNPVTQKRGYKGETRLLLFQNLHRFSLYLALPFIPILYYDGFLAFFRHGEFGIGVGTVVLLINATLLAGYTLGCHSLRHLIGGKDDCMSCGKATVRFNLWKSATWFNVRHMQFAWTSLFFVALTDLYVRLVSMGVITDWNTWN